MKFYVFSQTVCCSDRPCITTRLFSAVSWICTSLCQVFKSPKNHIKLQGEMYDQSKGSNVIIFWVLQVSPTHVGFFFPSVGDMWAAAKKLFCQPSDEPQWTFVKDYEGSFSVFHNWNVTSDHWEKDKRAAWEPNRKTFWTLGPSSCSISEKQF